MPFLPRLYSMCRGAALAATVLYPQAVFAQEEPKVAVAEFDFRDTSGEVRDQREDHARRLAAFSASLRELLAERHGMTVVPLTCSDSPCSSRDPGVRKLVARAAEGGAEHLIVGEFHKVSTLIGWIHVYMIDVATGNEACARLMSYRGDTDEAWARAANFAERDIATYCLPEEPAAAP